MKKRILTVILALALWLCLFSLGASASEAPETEIVREDVFSLESGDSASDLTLFSRLNTVPLKEGRYAAWIDRLDLTDADFALPLYEALVEASDGDGTDDWLIDPETAVRCEVKTSSNPNPAPKYGIKICKYGDIDDFCYTSVDDVYDAYYAWLNANDPYIYAVAAAFNRDHPEAFWVTTSVRYTAILSIASIQGTLSYEATLYLVLQDTNPATPYDIRHEDYREADVILSARNEMEEQITALLTATKGKSARETVRAFDEYLTRHNEYNTSGGNYPDVAHMGYTALMGNIGVDGPVCDGYARALKILCDRAGIPCTLVNGQASSSQGSERHMWNYVQIDDFWYAVDTTWNDPVGGPSGAVSGHERDDYLLVGRYSRVGRYNLSESHRATNIVFLEATAFTNGPELSNNPCYLGQQTTTPTPSAYSVETLLVQLAEQSIPGELVEYACTSSPDETPVNWQKNLLFELDAPGTYYFFTRVAETTMHNAGQISAPLELTLVPEVTSPSITMSNTGDGTYFCWVLLPADCEPCTLFCATYSSDGKMLGVQAKACTGNPRFSFTFDTETPIDSVRAFLLEDMDSVPLAPHKSL